jgi:subtilisin-like proprotein convertase family protein
MKTCFRIMSSAVLVLSALHISAGESEHRRGRLDVDEEDMRPKPKDMPDLAEAYFVEQRAPIGATDIPTGLYDAARVQADRLPWFSSSDDRFVVGVERSALDAWESLGPGNVGGRTRVLRFRPGTPSTMYMGAVAGGVWRSTDSGATWSPIGDLAPNVAITAMAIDTANPDRMFVGTGEGYFNVDAVRGVGIFQSQDGGATWTHLAATRNLPEFYRINDLVISPNDPQVLYAATRFGLYRTTNGGTTWTQQIDANAAAGCTDVAVRTDVPTNDTVIVSCGNFSPTAGTATTGTGIYRSANGNAVTPTWTKHLGPGGTTALTRMGRTSLAIAPNAQATMYALIACSAEATTGASACGDMGGTANDNHFDDGLLAVYRSTDGGVTWVSRYTNAFSEVQSENRELLLTNPLIGRCAICDDVCGVSASSSYGGQGWYDNVIAVDPLDATKVWVGGIDLWRSDDSGANWGVASYWGQQYLTPPYGNTTIANYAHADQHGIWFHPGFNGVANQTMYVTNDGGIQRTNNARAAVGTSAGITQTTNSICGKTGTLPAVTWTSLNNSYSVTQFYNGTVFPNGTTYFGGAQDNGTNLGSDGGPNAWTEINGGDGGYVAVKPSNTNILYAETTGISIERSTDGGATFTGIVGGISAANRNCGSFINPFIMDPNSETRLYTSNHALWRTNNPEAGTVTWTQASAALPGTACPASTTANSERLSAYAVAPGDATLLVAGATRGQICRLTNATTSTNATAWSACTEPAGDGSYVSSIAFDTGVGTPTAQNSRIVYATVSTFGVGHVWKSTNGGQAWTSIDGSGATKLPDVPAHTIVSDPAYAPGLRLYVGTDLGVFVSIDGGANWARENAGFANTVVEHLQFSNRTVGSLRAPASGKLFAFTHGRGAFRTSLRAAAGSCASGSVAIPDNSGTGASLPVSVSGLGTGTTTIDVDVRVGISHTRVSDLRATLTHVASGTTVELFNRPAVPTATAACTGSGDNVDALFDDDADYLSETECVDASTPTLSGRFKPSAALSALSGLSVAGSTNWRLDVYDAAAGQTGTITQVCITPTANADATVPATITHVTSQRLSDEQVHVTFQAGAEVGVVAYELVDPARTTVGAGVKVVAHGDSLRAQTYDVVGSVRGETFWIRTLDVDGRRALKGPFAIGKDSGEWRDGAGSDIDWAVVRAQLAKAPRAPATVGDRVDLLVTRAGIQRVSFEAVAAGGGASLQGVPVNELALTLRGTPVPIRVFDDDGSFGTGDAIEFVGEPLTRPSATPSPHDSLYSGTARYRLSRDAALAARMWRTRSASGDFPPPGDIVRKRRFEDNTSYYFSSSLADPWTWRRVVAMGAPASSDVALVLPDLDPARPVRMSVTIQGGLTVDDVDPDHHVVVQVNGDNVADLRFDGLSADTIDIELPAGLLQVGANTVRIEAPGDNGFSADVVYLEDVALDYAAVPTAEDGRAEFAIASGQAAAPPVTPDGVVFADGFDASASNCDGCRLLAVAGIGATHRIVLEHAGATYWVDDAATDAQGVRFVLPVSIDDRFVVANADALLQPGVAPAANVAALDHAGGAAYVAIASPSLAAALQPLLQAKQAQGLSTHVVTTDAIYERYAHGVPDGEAIRRFIADAQRDWGTRYVLLAGGDSYDYRDEFGLGTVSHVPTLYRPADGIVRFAASDAALADTDGDGVADVALGRLPARTPAELERMVAKSLAFEGNVSGNALFVADADDGGLSFASRTDEQSGNFAGYGIRHAYRDDYPGAIPGTYDDAGMHAEIVSSFEAGVRLVHFFGHSASPQWTSGAVLTSSQLRAGALANTTMPLVAQWGCWNGYFVDPYANSLAQVFLAIEQGGGAVIGASGLTSAEADHALASAFYQELVKPGARVGDALLLARQTLAAQQPTLRDVQVAVNLFGDPAARFGANQ